MNRYAMGLGHLQASKTQNLNKNEMHPSPSLPTSPSFALAGLRRYFGRMIPPLKAAGYSQRSLRD